MNDYICNMEEIWKDITGYEGIYQVSNLGRVRSFKIKKTGKLLKPRNSHGYLYVYLGKNYPIHQLVAMVFLNHTPDGHKIIVDHIDNNSLNNRLDNLQLITQRRNAIKDRTSDNVGVYKVNNKFRAIIHIDNKPKHLGYFFTVEEATQAYKNELMKIESRYTSN